MASGKEISSEKHATLGLLEGGARREAVGWKSAKRVLFRGYPLLR